MCNLCSIPEREAKDIIYIDEDMFIVPTRNTKGHRKRIMCVSHKHKAKIDNEEFQIAKFIEFCKEYFDEEPTFTICESTYATIPEHWHMIACDWFGEEDIKQLHYTPHTTYSTYVKWRP